MKSIGILGGMGPESTVTYYEYITREDYKRFGDYAFPEIIIYSVRFQRFIDLFMDGKWEIVAEETLQGLERLYKAGADFGIMATNTLHVVFERTKERSPIPLISIMDPVIEAIKNEEIYTVGLLGTIFTVKEGFYTNRLGRDGIQTLVPDGEDQQRVQEIIASELTVGNVKKKSKES